MTQKEFLDALRHLGISQRRLAIDLGVDPNTVNRWATGKHPVAPYAAHLLIQLGERHRLAATLRSIADRLDGSA